ncbi:alpha/beta hydrolase [Chromobacterium violaceum]|uniref:alpha/beta hydrolase n=1 Tax=Chromobacterium violaceum TaxID=536 RepID=UPI0018E082AF|nr:alpha/beta hydrolase [Chromobacterium violaceum]
MNLAIEQNDDMKQEVIFLSEDLELVGHLYRPADYQPEKRYPAIVVSHPFTGVKEQVAGRYAERLAQAGYLALAFDTAYQGESEGLPRHLETPHSRAEGIKSAVSYLSNLPDVDPERIGALGIAAGGGYAVFAARTDTRIKAVAAVNAVCQGSLLREGLNGSRTPEQLQSLLAAAADDRTAQDRGEAAATRSALAETAQAAAEQPQRLLREAYDYYRTPRGRHPNAENRFVESGLDALAGFDAFARIDMLAPRPLLMIAGAEADTRYFSERAIAAAAEPKELCLIAWASHFDLYDREPCVAAAAARLKVFFDLSLA